VIIKPNDIEKSIAPETDEESDFPAYIETKEENWDSNDGINKINPDYLQRKTTMHQRKTSNIEDPTFS